MFFPDNYEFYCPVKINSGNRALENLPFELDALNARKPLIVTDKENAKKGLIKKITDAFKDSGMTLGIFDGVPPVPDRKLVRGLMNRYRDTGCDSIIAAGEGVVVDTAKALNIVVSGRPEDLHEAAGEDMIQNPLGPFVFVPEGEAVQPDEVDAITGATRTSVAVGGILNRAVENADSLRIF